MRLATTLVQTTPKTAGLISTTPTETTMTTNDSGFQFVRAPDLFSPNDCINLPARHDNSDSTQLSCISLVRSSPLHPSTTAQRALRYAVELLAAHNKQQLWLLACSCDEDNRITRHRGLWGTLSKSGIKKGHKTTAELAKQGNGRVCFYGGSSYSDNELHLFLDNITPLSRSFCALLPIHAEPNIERLVHLGWSRGPSSLVELRDIATLIGSSGGIVLRLFGQFDDRLAGVDCIMSRMTYDANPLFAT